MKTTIKKYLRWLAVFLVTFIVCTAGSMPVFVTSLFVHEVISYPLTILVMGLLAALTASWMSNILCGDSTHSRILRIVGITEIIAILLILLRGVFYIVQFGSNILLLATWGIVLSLSAYLAAWHFRSSEYSRRRDIIMSLILFALAPIIVIVTIAIASRFGLTGA
ncbi:hypothetical protein ACFLV1_00630 [Chloroflexota bacterium]